jgi:hypothetical protein
VWCFPGWSMLTAVEVHPRLGGRWNVGGRAGEGVGRGVLELRRTWEIIHTCTDV